MSSKGKRLVLRRLRREGLNGPNRTLARLQGPTEDVRRAGRTAEASGDGRVRARRRRHAREKAARGVDGRGHLGSNRLMDRKRAGVVVVRVRLSQLPFSGLPLRRLSIALFGGVTLPLPRFSLPQVEVSHLTLALFHGRSRAGMGVRRMLGQGGQRLGGSRLRRRREMGRRRLSWLLREPGQRCDRVTSLLTRSIERGWRRKTKDQRPSATITSTSEARKSRKIRIERRGEGLLGGGGSTGPPGRPEGMCWWPPLGLSEEGQKGLHSTTTTATSSRTIGKGRRLGRSNRSRVEKGHSPMQERRQLTHTCQTASAGLDRAVLGYCRAASRSANRRGCWHSWYRSRPAWGAPALDEASDVGAKNDRRKQASETDRKGLAKSTQGRLAGSASSGSNEHAGALT